jgi:hypothetical protein
MSAASQAPSLVLGAVLGVVLGATPKENTVGLGGERVGATVQRGAALDAALSRPTVGGPKRVGAAFDAEVEARI